MNVHDPLYGEFEIPTALARLASTPEVRRLSQIRLLNTLSPTLAVLGELRRFSHTLGVLHLSGLVKTPGFSPPERDALRASVLLHDIGTPPFGHLFEYHLRDSRGWSHEGVIRDLLWGFHAPENRGHQLFAGRTIEFGRIMKAVGISQSLVEDIISNRHPLAQLLFGTVDLDNIDNVTRMGWALGLKFPPDLGANLAMQLGIDREGRLTLPRSANSLFSNWRALRRNAYSVIVFDMQTVAAQAILSHAIREGFKDGVIGPEDWTLSDEGLLGRLRDHPPLKALIGAEFLGRLPTPVFVFQLRGDLRKYAFASREDAETFLLETIREAFPRQSPVAYVFVDKGTFEKQCRFRDPDGNEWSEGKTSQSVVFYGFVRQTRPLPVARCAVALEVALKRLSVEQDDLMLGIASPLGHHGAQSSITFSH